VLTPPNYYVKIIIKAGDSVAVQVGSQL